MIAFRILMTIFTATALWFSIKAFAMNDYKKKSEVVVAWMLIIFFLLNIFAIWN